MRRAITDTLIIAERNLVRLPRAPDLLLAFTVQPIMFVLLFRYVFGGAISTPGFSYVDFLIPGIIVQNIAFGGFVTAIGLNEDVHKGLIDRFRSLPMARAAVRALEPMSDEDPAVVDGVVRVNVRQRQGTIVEAVRRLSDAGVGVDDLNVRRPTLDDVFLTLTGHVAEETEDGSPAPLPAREEEAAR